MTSLELYARHKALTVTLSGQEEMTAVSSLNDGIHIVEVTLVCRASTAEIISAQAKMIKYPWNLCEVAAKQITLIEGLKIGPGIRSEIERRIGKKKGCTHVVDLAIEAVRGIIQGQYRLRYLPTTREERINMVQSDMEGTCFSYSNPHLNLEATGDWAEGALLPEQYEELKRIMARN